MAAVWAWTFARAAGIRLPVYAPLLLGLGTWLLYVADRILDGLGAPGAGSLRARHHFYARHRRAFVGAAVVAGAALLWMIAGTMPARARREDALLFSAAMLYFLLIHTPGGRRGNLRRADALRADVRGLRDGDFAGVPGGEVCDRERWFPKELAVGLLFAAATAVPAWSRMSGGHAELVPLVALFAALCWLNCVAIETWEHPRQLAGAGGNEGGGRRPHSSTRYVGAHVRGAALGIALAACGAAVAAGLCSPAGAFAGGAGAAALHGTAAGAAVVPARWIAASLAACVSALLLLLLDAVRPRLSVLHLRIAVDAALLAPLLFLPVLR